MEIMVGKTSGFCYGVKRAVEGTIGEIEEHSKQVCCLGELVHNRQVIDKLKNLGVKCIEKIDEANGTTIIRAHGVPKDVYDIAKEKNIELKDYTCPNVLKIHDIAQKYTKDGYFIILLGNKEHPENIGTLSYCDNYYVIEDEDDVLQAMIEFKRSKINKLLLISQTTFSIEKFDKIKGILQNEVGENINFIVKNTICRATELRQKETEKMSKVVDMMIIIGGKNSSNTKKLYDVARKNCENTVLIENAKELEMSKSVDKVGIMAGASTPKESIDEVISILENCSL